MTPKKQAFVDAYISDIRRNATAAAIKAGYSPKTAKQTAYKLMHDAEIKSAIAAAKKALHEQNTAETDEVIEFLTTVMRGGEVDTVPLSIGGGKQKLFDGKPTARERIKAAELLGKYYNIFDNGTNTNDTGGGIIIIPEIDASGGETAESNG